MVTKKEASIDVIKQELSDFKDEVVNRLQRIEDKITYTNGKIAKAITDIELNKQKVGIIENGTPLARSTAEKLNSLIANCEKNHTPAKDWKVMIITAIIGIVSVIISNGIINALKN